MIANLPPPPPYSQHLPKQPMHPRMTNIPPETTQTSQNIQYLKSLFLLTDQKHVSLVSYVQCQKCGWPWQKSGNIMLAQALETFQTLKDVNEPFLRFFSPVLISFVSLDLISRSQCHWVGSTESCVFQVSFFI